MNAHSGGVSCTVASTVLQPGAIVFYSVSGREKEKGCER